jgi:L-alanine-DL-glutamate epimerase-like enolase superfamily enzyme
MSATTNPATDAVIAADLFVVAVPLPRPISVKGCRFDEREYVVVRLRTAAGVKGAALGYTRGLPLVAALERLIPSLIETGADEATARAQPDLIATTTSPANVRAHSLVDLALWDVAAQGARLPLWRLLGAAKARVPILAVGGYSLDQRTAEDVQGEFGALADLGFRHLKLHADDPHLVAQLARELPDGVTLAVDLQMRYRELEQALKACRALDQLGLSFIEDPFPPELPHLTRALAEKVDTPIAAGEDAAGSAALLELAAAADVIRVDATASGGIDAVTGAIQAATRAGKRVITHAFVELHAQVAGGLAEIGLAETIPYDSGANPVDRLLAETQPITDGEIVLSEQPGNGLIFDWEAVAHYTRETWSYDIERRTSCN